MDNYVYIYMQCMLGTLSSIVDKACFAEIVESVLGCRPNSHVGHERTIMVRLRSKEQDSLQAGTAQEAY